MTIKRELTPFPSTLNEALDSFTTPSLNARFEETHNLITEIAAARQHFEFITKCASTLQVLIAPLGPKALKIAARSKNTRRVARHLDSINSDILALNTYTQTTRLPERLMSLMVMAAEDLSEMPDLLDDENKENIIADILSRLQGQDPFSKRDDDDTSIATSTSSTSLIDVDEAEIPALPEIALEPTMAEEADHLALYLNTAVCSSPETRTCVPPKGFRTLLKDGEKDEAYWKRILDTLLTTQTNTHAAYKGTPIPLFAGGPPHAPFFIAHRLVSNTFIVGPTKRKVAQMVVD